MSCINPLLAPLLVVVSMQAADTPPASDTYRWRDRALASMKRSEKALENYSCVVHGQYDNLNDKGAVSDHESRIVERFFVNGVKIDHLLSRDGKPLSGSDAAKEQRRVDKEVKLYSNPKEAAKRQDRREQQLNTFLRAQRLLDGRRETRNGRQLLFYRLEGDPTFRPKTLEERFAQALTGRMWIDEQTGTPAELRIETIKDLKIAGGLFATLHKGFGIHLIQEPQPDGAWITKSLEGNGDVRALFFHPRFRFREWLENCHQFSVDSKAITQSPESVPPLPED